MQKLIFETFLSNLFLDLPRFAKIMTAKPYFSSPRYIPKNYQKTKLFNIHADRMNAPK